MYWPIGAPKVYALSNHPIPASGTQAIEDGTAHGEHDGPGGVNGLGSTTPPRLLAEGEDAGGASVKQNGARREESQDNEILAAKVSRGGSIFATITGSTLTVWQTKPTVALAAVERSAKSMKSYGPSTALLMRPDGLIIVVQTALGFLITYTLATDPQALVYQTQLPTTTRHARKDSADGYSNYKRPSTAGLPSNPGEQDGIREVNLRFRMVIRIDAGISKALALDDEIVVATRKPAAVQCIRWVAEEGVSQTNTELLSRMSWLTSDAIVTEMVHDRPMNLSCWLTDDGKAFAVQRVSLKTPIGDGRPSLFQGFCFREPETAETSAVKVAINARFSLIAVGLANGNIDVYAVKDYTGNIPLSHQLREPHLASNPGQLLVLAYSPDGYSLFAGYASGWAMWSVYGKLTASSLANDMNLSKANQESWLHGIKDAFWMGGGCELAMLSIHDDRLWVMEMARSAATGCLSSANVAKGLLHSSNSIITYKGQEVADLTGLPADAALWQTVQVPNYYLVNHWPIKTAVASSDGKYVAVAGRRGLAHYSVSSGRWKTFDDPEAEQSFAVRGGMCWHQHFLIASIESGNRHQIRIFSREKALERVLFTEDLNAPAILTTMSGHDSLLVYTYDNVLYHYIVAPNGHSVKLVQVGQIRFHGIIRAPPRVRTISWILAEDQLEHGDPSQDVATATVLFLVDGKLVLLQPSTNEYGELKYDMRVIAQNVEYYILMRDQSAAVAALKGPDNADTSTGSFALIGPLGHSLRDSLWYFDGDGYHLWSDVQDVLACAPVELGRDLPPAVRIPMDFYPVSAMVAKGVAHGLDVDLVQRRDIDFSFFRLTARTQLFLPQLLRYHLAEYNSPAALHLASSYSHLPYFSHALEILLHDVLDSEVDSPPSPPETALLPTVISFLSSFPAYLDIVVNCTRKTELRSWRTLFSYLPPVQELFEQSLAQQKLNTAAGYLLVLHAFEQDEFQVHEFARLLREASADQDWDLCGEVARFLVGIDSSGQTLTAALAEAALRDAPNGNISGVPLNGF
jgi:RAB6A-GEF complex partner protein 1